MGCQRPKRDWNMACTKFLLSTARLARDAKPRCRRKSTMVLSIHTLSPLIALIAGTLILIMPRLLNYVIALYLIIIGLLGLFGSHLG
jgi:hypothetical protein